MTLIRRCDGCGNDIPDPFGRKYLSLKLPLKASADELDFHDEECVALWSDRNRGKARP